MKKTVLILVLFYFCINSIFANNSHGIAKGTLVTLADGVEISIEEIKVGDQLLTINANNQTIHIVKVTNIKEKKSNHLHKIILADGSEVTIASNQLLLSDKGWTSADSKKSKELEVYLNYEIKDHKIDSFIYSVDSNVKIEILPIIEIQDIEQETKVYSLTLDTTDVAFIANKFFVGQ